MSGLDLSQSLSPNGVPPQGQEPQSPTASRQQFRDRAERLIKARSEALLRTDYDDEGKVFALPMPEFRGPDGPALARKRAISMLAEDIKANRDGFKKHLLSADDTPPPEGWDEKSLAPRVYPSTTTLKDQALASKYGEALNQYRQDNPVSGFLMDKIQMPLVDLGASAWQKIADVGVGAANLFGADIKTPDMKAAFLYLGRASSPSMADSKAFGAGQEMTRGTTANILSGATSTVGGMIGMGATGAFKNAGLLENAARLAAWEGIASKGENGAPATPTERLKDIGVGGVLGVLGPAFGQLAKRFGGWVLGQTAERMAKSGLGNAAEAVSKFAKESGITRLPNETREAFFNRIASEFGKQMAPGLKVPALRMIGTLARSGVESAGFSLLDEKFRSRLIDALANHDYEELGRLTESVAAGALGIAGMHVALRDTPRIQRLDESDAQGRFAAPGGAPPATSTQPGNVRDAEFEINQPQLHRPRPQPAQTGQAAADMFNRNAAAQGQPQDPGQKMANQDAAAAQVRRNNAIRTAFQRNLETLQSLRQKQAESEAQQQDAARSVRNVADLAAQAAETPRLDAPPQEPAPTAQGPSRMEQAKQKAAAARANVDLTESNILRLGWQPRVARQQQVPERSVLNRTHNDQLRVWTAEQAADLQGDATVSINQNQARQLLRLLPSKALRQQLDAIIQSDGNYGDIKISADEFRKMLAYHTKKAPRIRAEGEGEVPQQAVNDAIDAFSRKALVAFGKDAVPSGGLPSEPSPQPDAATRGSDEIYPTDGNLYRSFDDPSEQGGKGSRHVLRGRIGYGGAYTIEMPDSGATYDLETNGSSRAVIKPEAVTRVFYDPNYWSGGKVPAGHLESLREMYPNAEQIPVRLSADEGHFIRLPSAPVVELAEDPAVSYEIKGGIGFPSPKLQEALGIPAQLPANDMLSAVEHGSLLSALQGKIALDGDEIDASSVKGKAYADDQPGLKYSIRFGQIYRAPLEPGAKWEPVESAPSRGKDQLDEVQQHAVMALRQILNTRHDISQRDLALLSQSIDVLDSVSRKNDPSVEDTIHFLADALPALAQVEPEHAGRVIKGIAESLTTKHPDLVINDMMADAARRAAEKAAPEPDPTAPKGNRKSSRSGQEGGIDIDAIVEGVVRGVKGAKNALNKLIEDLPVEIGKYAGAVGADASRRAKSANDFLRRQIGETAPTFTRAMDASAPRGANRQGVEWLNTEEQIAPGVFATRASIEMDHGQGLKSSQPVPAEAQHVLDAQHALRIELNQFSEEAGKFRQKSPAQLQRETAAWKQAGSPAGQEPLTHEPFKTNRTLRIATRSDMDEDGYDLFLHPERPGNEEALLKLYSIPGQELNGKPITNPQAVVDRLKQTAKDNREIDKTKKVDRAVATDRARELKILPTRIETAHGVKQIRLGTAQDMIHTMYGSEVLGNANDYGFGQDLPEPVRQRYQYQKPGPKKLVRDYISAAEQAGEIPKGSPPGSSTPEKVIELMAKRFAGIGEPGLFDYVPKEIRRHVGDVERVRRVAQMSLSFMQDLPEMIGNVGVVGVRRTLLGLIKAGMSPRAAYGEALRLGAVMKGVSSYESEWSMKGGAHKVAAVIGAAKHLSSKASEVWSDQAAKILEGDVRAFSGQPSPSGNLFQRLPRSWQRENLTQHLEQLNFEPGQIQEMLDGTASDNLYGDIRRRFTAAHLGSKVKTEKSSLLGSKRFTSLVQFWGWPSNKLRQNGRLLKTLGERIKAGDAVGSTVAATNLMKQAVGMGVGAVLGQYLAWSLMEGPKDAFDQFRREFSDNWMRFIWRRGIVPALSGGILGAVTGVATSDRRERDLLNATVPGSIAVSLFDMIEGDGPYKNQTPWQMLGTFISRHVPIMKPVSALMSAIGLAESVSELPAAARTLNDWKRAEGIPMHTAQPTEEDQTDFQATLRSLSRLIQDQGARGKKPEEIAAMPEFKELGNHALFLSTGKAIGGSMQSRGLLDGLDSEQLSKATKVLGHDKMVTLYSADRMLEQFAKSFAKLSGTATPPGTTFDQNLTNIVEQIRLGAQGKLWHEVYQPAMEHAAVAIEGGGEPGEEIDKLARHMALFPESLEPVLGDKYSSVIKDLDQMDAYQAIKGILTKRALERAKGDIRSRIK